MSYSDLKAIANGKYATRLDFLRRKAEKTPVGELYLLLDPKIVENAAEEHFARRAYHLESWRNGLVLLPLFLTWLSLALAALAYIQTYTLSPDPFFKQWVDGFPKAHLPVLSFIDVAAIDAFLLLVLLFLTIFAHWFEANAQRKASRLRIWLDEEMYSLASSSLVKSLGNGDDNKQPAWAVEVHTAISRLSNALIGVESLVSSSQKTLTELVSNSQATFQNLVQASQEKLDGSVRQFGGALQDQRQAVEKFMGGTIEVRRAVDKLERIYTDGEQIYLGLNQTLPKIEGAFTTMASDQKDAASALKSISSETNQATKSVGAIAQQFTQTELVHSTSQAAQQMQQTAQMMQKIAAQMQETVNKQILLQKQIEQANKVPSQPRKRTFTQKLFGLSK